MTSFSLAAWKLAVVLGAAPAPGAPPPLEPKQKLTCAAAGETSLDKPFTLRCSAAPGLNAASVVLWYRQGGAQDFIGTPAMRTKPGAYAVALCSHDVVAGPLQYYFEAKDGAGKVVASDGDEESPSVLVVAGPPAVAVSKPLLAVATPSATSSSETPLPVRATIGDDNDPLAAARRARDEDRLAGLRSKHRQPGPMIGAGLGLGYGFYGERTLDFNRDLSTGSSSGVAGLPLILPEVGWQIDDRWAASLQLRWQQLDPGGAGDPRLGSPAKRSWAILARGQYQLGEGRLRPFVGGNIGYGDGFRVVVPANSSNEEARLLRDDTIRGGAFVVGPGGGLLYHFSPNVAALAEVRALAGLPNFAFVTELSAGVQLGF